jgi:hypothetical protein
LAAAAKASATAVSAMICVADLVNEHVDRADGLGVSVPRLKSYADVKPSLAKAEHSLRSSGLALASYGSLPPSSKGSLIDFEVSFHLDITNVILSCFYFKHRND